MEDMTALIIGGLALSIGMICAGLAIHMLRTEVRRLEDRATKAETNIEMMKFDLNRFRGIR